MLFNSVHFLLFFPVVTTAYFLLPHRFRWSMLLAASCFFYMAFIPKYILILFTTIIVDYLAGLWIERTTGPSRRTALVVSIISTVSILFVFKYFNFFNANMAALARALHWNYSIEGLRLILPIGLSFHTFQSMSYVIEVYRGRQKAEKNFGIYSLYVMFYPQLVAGPIERPQNLLHQFYERHDFDYTKATEGLKLMAWGMFKKVVIADRLSLFVNPVYDNPTRYEGISLLVATVFFAFQIYCDFSGYSDIAIGSARVMGFRLMQNFNRPYHAKSVAEFWKRWHISLSTWFKDYLYIPLGGSRVTTLRWVYNIMVTFLVSGLWHGANWTYVVWGALNGLALIAEFSLGRLLAPLSRRLRLNRIPTLAKTARIFATFSFINVTWIFFRANTLSDAVYILTHLFTGIKTFLANYTLYLLAVNFDLGLAVDKSIRLAYLAGQSVVEWRRALIAVALLELVHLLQRHGSVQAAIAGKPAWVRWTTYYGLVMGILLFGVFEQVQFIYFQF